MRILHAYKIYRPDIEGGIPAVMSSLAEADDGNQHSILCARRSGVARKLTVDGVPVDAVSSLGTLFSTPLAPAYIPQLISRARTSDLVIHHAPMPLTDAAIVAGLPPGVALIVYWHAEIVGFALLRDLVSPLLRRVLERADRIVVSGQPMIDHSDFLRPHAHKCAVVPYGLDFEDWRQIDERDRIEAENIRRSKPRHIVSVGRLVGYKGYDVLTRAMRSVDADLTIVGEGVLHDELRQLASTLEVADRVHFAGRLPRNEIKQLFHAAQVYAFPSVTVAEAFGIVQIEAMASGLPIVNTDLASTVPEVARHDIEGLTVPPGDVDALAGALNRILDDADLRDRFSTAAVRRAAEFDQSIFRARMADIYEDATRSRKTAVLNQRRGS
ncbi:MAG: glycosyltransferase [Rhodopseudomonas palustris]|uniref:Glycosyltransferase n=1 Tax=Rhodopseudomonas palustris TaxID=1076 RepID=A0A933W4W0_RHOPL|nr:glycosyltransferase [Rhodopseudomonas palustris]